MEWIAAMQEAIGYMEEHLLEETDYELYYDGARPDVFCELWIPIKKK